MAVEQPKILPNVGYHHTACNAAVFARFEVRRPQVSEIVLLAVMTAFAVAGRVAFYWAPQFKPVCAIVILTAVAFNAEAGFITGAAAGLISNMFFGQGPWTPWQMFGFGLVGFLPEFCSATGK